MGVLASVTCAMEVDASQRSCDAWFDGVRASRRVELPPAERMAFVEFMRANHATLGLGWGAVFNDDHYDIILSDHGGTIAIFAETEADEDRAFLRLQTCNPTEDWRPFWTGFLKLVNRFPRAKGR
jgi:hypothetical protein